MRAQQQSLALNERVRANGPSSVEAGINHANIGVVHRDLGQWEWARTEFETALSIMEPVLGEDHLEVAQVKKYLGDILRRAGELEIASQLINQVTEIHQRRPGEEHKLAACLSAGATIVLDCVEELAPKVRQLVSSFRDALHASAHGLRFVASADSRPGFRLIFPAEDRDCFFRKNAIDDEPP